MNAAREEIRAGRQGLRYSEAMKYLTRSSTLAMPMFEALAFTAFILLMAGNA